MLEFDLKALCEQAGVSLYDDELVSENGRKIYRVYIAKKGGVSLEEALNSAKFYRLYLMSSHLVRVNTRLK